MFGWEYPPYKSGGLGTACYGLTKGLKNHDVDIIFVLPRGDKDKADTKYVKMLIASDYGGSIKFIGIPTILTPYMTSESYISVKGQEGSAGSIYGSDLFQEVYNYTQRARIIAEKEEYDLIHCHDWMTYPAGIAAKKATGKKLIVHLHATEFDRTGGNGVNEYVYNIEKNGFEIADKIIAVSQFAKDMITKHYGINPGKITVVHNAVEKEHKKFQNLALGNEKIILFLGRLTLQKGPEYFVYAAKKVLEKRKDVKFVMVGTGDMLERMINLTIDMGINQYFLFTGFLEGEALDKVYSMARLYVMPSVSEPFGITPLESITNGTPVLISKQSGVSEVLNHALKVDFWDVDEIANKIMAVLKHDELHETLRENGQAQVNSISWDKSAKKVLDVYKGVMGW
jgi:glycosyltransferase involved in cell wall biosynthesis